VRKNGELNTLNSSLLLGQVLYDPSLYYFINLSNFFPTFFAKTLPFCVIGGSYLGNSSYFDNLGDSLIECRTKKRTSLGSSLEFSIELMCFDKKWRIIKL